MEKYILLEETDLDNMSKRKYVIKKFSINLSRKANPWSPIHSKIYNSSINNYLSLQKSAWEELFKGGYTKYFIGDTGYICKVVEQSQEEIQWLLIN